MGKFTLRNDFCIVTFVFMPLSETYLNIIFTSFLAMTAIVNYHDAYGDWLGKRLFLDGGWGTSHGGNGGVGKKKKK